MEETISKALILVSFILGGYVLKQAGIFSRQSFETISSIVFRITLPAAIIVNLNGVHFELNYLWISIVAILFNFLYIGMGYVLGRDREEKSFLMLNLNGFNIGNFALPFVSYFFDKAAVLIVCLFDAGNSIMCMGMGYGIAAYVRGHNDGENIFKMLGKILLTSAPVLAYASMILLAIAGLQLPDLVIQWVKIPASANTFLSMLMIGVALGVSLKPEFIQLVTKNLVGRLAGSLVMAGIAYMLPYSLDIRKVIIILSFAPIAGMACYFTAKMKANIQVAACISSLSILISIIIMSALIIVLSHVTF